MTYLDGCSLGVLGELLNWLSVPWSPSTIRSEEDELYLSEQKRNSFLMYSDWRGLTSYPDSYPRFTSYLGSYPSLLHGCWGQSPQGNISLQLPGPEDLANFPVE